MTTSFRPIDQTPPGSPQAPIPPSPIKKVVPRIQGKELLLDFFFKESAGKKEFHKETYLEGRAVSVQEVDEVCLRIISSVQGVQEFFVTFFKQHPVFEQYPEFIDYISYVMDRAFNEK